MLDGDVKTGVSSFTISARKILHGILATHPSEPIFPEGSRFIAFSRFSQTVKSCVRKQSYLSPTGSSESSFRYPLYRMPIFLPPDELLYTGVPAPSVATTSSL